MEELLNNTSLRKLDGQDLIILVEACLKNRWLRRGIPCDESLVSRCCDDFHVCVADRLDQLREYFRESSHATRDGIVFGNLAFVQQVDMGDEWLVLRRCFDDDSNESYWHPFESYSFAHVIRSAARFECAIQALQDDDRFDTAVLFGTSSRQRQMRVNS